MAIESINPATGTLLRRYEPETDAAVREKIEKARRAFESWRTVPFAERAVVLRKAAELMKAEARNHAETMASEMGKPITMGVGEAVKCASVCDYYAENGEALLSPEPVESDGSEAYVRFDPIGPVLAVMPWNFPFWQVFRFAAPALMAGNVGLLKHASNVPACALAIEDLWTRAGLPAGCFQTLLIESSQVRAVIEHPAVEAVTLTGSDPAGRAVASAAGGQIKKSVLELGGSDPFVVLADADLDHAASVGAFSRAMNTGQTCIAAKRFIVERSVIETFTAKFKDALAAMVVGDPLEEGTQVGPMAREDLRNDIHMQVERTMRDGAEVLLGGVVPDGPGFYYPVTLMTGVTTEMAAAREETFGPLAAVIEAADEEDAIRIANDTEFGLGASVWTRDVEKGKVLAARIEAGNVFVNGLVKSDPRMPFGGTTRSGYGRELARQGIREFVNVKTVWVG